MICRKNVDTGDMAVVLRSGKPVYVCKHHYGVKQEARAGTGEGDGAIIKAKTA